VKAAAEALEAWRMAQPFFPSILRVLRRDVPNVTHSPLPVREAAPPKTDCWASTRRRTAIRLTTEPDRGDPVRKVICKPRRRFHDTTPSPF